MPPGSHLHEALHQHEDLHSPGNEDDFLHHHAPFARGTSRSCFFDDVMPRGADKSRRLAASDAAAFLQGPAGTSAPSSSSKAGRNSRSSFMFAGSEPDLSHSQSTQNAWLHPPSSRRAGARTVATTSFLFQETTDRLLKWAENVPPVALVPLHATGIVAGFPGTVAFELVEGYLFGASKGIALAFAGKSLGALVAFLVARAALQFEGISDGLRKQMKAWPTAQLAAKGAERGGAGFVILARLSPIPCCVNNYAIAFLTDIPWYTYIPASFVGLFPMTVANVYAGALAPPMSGLAAPGHGAMQALAAASSFASAMLLSVVAGWFVFSQSALDSEGAAGHESDAEPEPELSHAPKESTCMVDDDRDLSRAWKERSLVDQEKK